MHKVKTLWFLLSLTILSAGCGSGSGGSSDDSGEADVPIGEAIVTTKNAEGIANRVWDINQFVDHMVATRALGLIHANTESEFNRICSSGNLSVSGMRNSYTMIGEIAVDFNDCVIDSAYPKGHILLGYLERHLILTKVKLSGRMYVKTSIFTRNYIATDAVFENLQWKVMSEVPKNDGNSHYRISNGRLELRWNSSSALKATALANFSFLDLSKNKAGSAYSIEVEDYDVSYRIKVKSGRSTTVNPVVKGGTFHYGSKDNVSPITLSFERPLLIQGEIYTFGLRAKDNSKLAITERIKSGSGVSSVLIDLTSAGIEYSTIMPTKELGENHMLKNDGSLKAFNQLPKPAFEVIGPKVEEVKNAAGKDQFNMAKGILAFIKEGDSSDPEYDFLRHKWKMVDYPKWAKCEAPELVEDNCHWVNLSFRAYVPGDYRLIHIADDGIKREYQDIAGEPKQKIKNGAEGEYYVDGKKGKYVFTSNGKLFYQAATIIRLRILYDAPGFDVEPLASNELTQGEQINFSVDAHNNAEGTIRYSIVAGPPGIEMDKEGNVSWTASAPFFGSEGIAQNIVVGVGNEDRLSTKVVTVNVTDVEAEPPSVIPHLRLPAKPSGATIVDTDFDGIGEVLMASGTDFIYNIGLNSGHFKLEWNNPYQLASTGSVKAVKPITDNKGELKNYAVLTNLDLLIVNPDGKTLLTRAFPHNDGRAVNRFEVVDLDGDGVQEIIIAQKDANSFRYRIKVFNQGLKELWSSPISATSEFVIGDIDGDDVLEIIHASGSIYDGRSFEKQWNHGQSFGTRLVVIDADGDGSKEFVSINNANLVLFDFIDGKVVPAASAIAVDGIKNFIKTFAAANIDEDPAEELIIGTTSGRVKAFNLSADKKQMLMQWQTDPAGHGEIFEIMLGDVTGDNIDELVLIAKKVSVIGEVYHQLLKFMIIDLADLPEPMNSIGSFVPTVDFEWNSNNEEILSGSFQKVPSDANSNSYFKANVMHKGGLSLRVSRTGYQEGEKNGLLDYQPKVEHGAKLFSGTTSSLHSIAVDDNGDGMQDVMISTLVDPIDIGFLLGLEGLVLEIPMYGFKSFDFFTGENISDQAGDLLHFPSVIGYGDFDSDGDNDFLGLQVQKRELAPLLRPGLKLIVFGEGQSPKRITLIEGFENTFDAKPVKIMMADLNNDGVNEFIYMDASAITVYEVRNRIPFLSEVVTIPIPLRSAIDLIAADTNGNGKQELVLIRAVKPQPKDYKNVLVYDLALSFNNGKLTYTGPKEFFTNKIPALFELNVFGVIDAVTAQTLLVDFDDGKEAQCRELMVNTIACRVQSFIIVGFRRHGINKRTQVVALDARSGKAVWRSPVLPGNAIKQLAVIEVPDGSQHLHVITNSAAIITK